MASSEFQALSQDELRKRLYQTFKNRGVLDTLKTQLRNQLIHELMHPILSGELQPQAVSSEGSSLLIGASNSLVADHLHSCGYEYSLSVFYPESGLEKEKVFTMQDLLQLIRIHPKSSLYKSLTSGAQKENKKGFLIQMLMELTEHHLCKESRNAETQTISIPPYRESLVEKLQLIDEQFADIYPQHQKFESLEVKLIEYRKEIEDQLQAEMSEKLQHFKEVEIAKIRMEEKAQCQKEVSDLRREFERTNQAKSEALIAREKNAIERLQKQQEIEAKEVYTQRQSLLKDIEMIRTREAELKQRIESFELAQKLQEEKNKAVDDALRRREIAVKNIEETYDQKLKNELLKYQLELKEEYIARTTRVTEDEKKNKEKAILLREETIAVNSKKEEFKQVVSHAKELELELDSVKAQVLLVNKQNQLLTEKLKEIADYPLLKEEKLELQVQNKLLKQQLEETRNENLHFRDKLTQPSAEHVACQAELRRVEHAKKLEQDEFETHKQLLEKQLQSEVERCAQLKIQLLDYETTIRKLNVQVEDLKLQLKQTQTVLENEVYRNPKPSLVDRSVIDFTGDRIVPHDIYVDGAFLKNRAVTDIVVADDVPNVGYRQHSRTCNSSPDSDLEFVAKTKARIKELEKEAEYLEEAYRNYQHRVIQGAVANRTPTKTKSPLPLRNAVRFPLASQHRVMFVEDNLGPQHFSLSSPSGPRYVTPGHDDVLKNHLTTPRRRVSSSRRLSSTPLSKVERNNNSHILPEDSSESYLVSSQQSVDQPLSPILRTCHLSSSESAPSSPTSHGQKLSLHEQQADNQDLNDSSKPEKLAYEDLEEHNSSLKYQGDIPEQLESDVSHPSGDSINGSNVTNAVPATATSQQDLTVVDQSQSEEQKREENEKKWEEERRERDERRQRERQEALEREERELEKLNEEMKLIQDSLKSEEEEEEKKTDRKVEESEISNPDAKDNLCDPRPNPLEKYMKLIQQSREQELTNKSSKKEEEVSLIERLLSSEKDDRSGWIQLLFKAECCRCVSWRTG
ncbi:oral-facial-digital syndrome 1 protein isoform X1 [Mauremys mutica]|uniref:oral-facial-digital syndrome 1 protein isoform X1 n=1 Tax=Mauremys mutica TaxID=74926 RepID=UPI001D133AE0|nr:oral-facial-digital syndrome 1 protein isoform X1 [Mauremys mutica]XP_044885277.1 oral-facial-digital syndrome 1 protein isoform X1 [Mauremys mutica]